MFDASSLFALDRAYDVNVCDVVAKDSKFLTLFSQILFCVEITIGELKVHDYHLHFYQKNLANKQCDVMMIWPSQKQDHGASVMSGLQAILDNCLGVSQEFDFAIGMDLLYSSISSYNNKKRHLGFNTSYRRVRLASRSDFSYQWLNTSANAVGFIGPW